MVDSDDEVGVEVATPRTESAIVRGQINSTEVDYVPAEFARELERELKRSVIHCNNLQKVADPWKEAPDWANFIAISTDGSTWYFEKKPCLERCEGDDFRKWYAPLGGIVDFYRGPEILLERPDLASKLDSVEQV